MDRKPRNKAGKNWVAKYYKDLGPEEKRAMWAMEAAEEDWDDSEKRARGKNLVTTRGASMRKPRGG